MTTLIKHTLLFATALSMLACGDKEKTTMPDPIYESEREEVKEMTHSEKVALGKQLFEGKGTCASCHLADKKVIGPSVREIITVYDRHKADIVTFLKGEGDAIVDPSQFIIMQANFIITKKMSDIELQALETYMRTM